MKLTVSLNCDRIEAHRVYCTYLFSWVIVIIAGITSGAPLAEILEEQKFESKSEENYKRKTSRPTT